MSTRALIVITVFTLVLVKCENGGNLVSSYAKVSRSGSLSENQARSKSDGVEKFWTQQRSEPRLSKKQEPTKIYPQNSPVYLPSKRISHKQGYSYDDKIPGKGEVVLEDRFTLSRPLFSYEALKKPSENHYHPPNSNPDSKRETSLSGLPPTIPPVKDNSFDSDTPPVSYESPYSSYNPGNSPVYYAIPKGKPDSSDFKEQGPKVEKPKENKASASYDSPYSSYNPPESPVYYPKANPENSHSEAPNDGSKGSKPDFNPPPASYDSPYNSYNPPEKPSSYYYPKPDSEKSGSKDSGSQKDDSKGSKPDFNPPPASYDSPYNSYNPPERPSSYYYPKPSSVPKPSIYPPYVDPNDQKPKQPVAPVPYLEYNPSKPKPEKTESYLEYNPHHHQHGSSSGEENHHEHLHGENGDHPMDHGGSKLPEYLDYDPNDPHNHHHHHHNHDDDSKMEEPSPLPEMKPKFPPYLYHAPPSEDHKGDDHKDPFPPGTPPYLEYNPYEQKEKGPPTVQVDDPPTSDGDDHPPFGKIPEYLDHDPHHFPDFYHYPFPPIYHDLKPLTTTTTPAPEEKRVNKRPYTYYYIGRKLWYIPLYFSLYFIVYVFVLVLKSIARHKIQFNQYFEENRALKDNTGNMESVTEKVLGSIEDSTNKYAD